MAATTVTDRTRNTSTAKAKTESKFWHRWRRSTPAAHAAQPETASFPDPDAKTQILPQAHTQAPGADRENPAQLDPTPVLFAAGEAALAALAGKMSPQNALLALRKHTTELDWRLAQARRGAVNQAGAEEMAANLRAADEAARAVGGQLTAEPRPMVDAILERARMRSNPDQPTGRIPVYPKKTAFPAHLSDTDEPTIGSLLPAGELGAGDFLLDAGDTSAPNALAMWHLVEKTSLMGSRIVASLDDGRAVGFDPQERVWILPPFAAREHRESDADSAPATQVMPAVETDGGDPR